MIQFPDPNTANEDGLLAVGGSLEPEYLIAAYSQGIFPWFDEDSPILWWSPDPRMVLFPQEFKLSHSLRQIIRQKRFEVRIDTAFREVIEACSRTPRPGQEGTWITPEMIDAYTQLHELGLAHSFETYREGKLTGGLYGVSLGRCFFGESMFHTESNTSKVAFYELVQFALRNQFELIDAQQETAHLKSLGARSIPRAEFLKLLKHAIKSPTLQGKWNTTSH